MKIFFSITMILGGYVGFWVSKILLISFHIRAFYFLSYLSFGLAIWTWLWILYKMWQAVAKAVVKPRTTAAIAVLGMVLPLFNLYWIFQVFLGFAKDYNLFLKQELRPAQPLNETVFLSFCIGSVLSVLPYVGLIITAINLFVFCFLIPKIWAAIDLLQTSQIQISLSDA